MSVADEAVDSITLDTWDATSPQVFLVEGPVLPRAINEWAAGFKIGKATYDEREHCFWLVLDDFSGGVGYKKLDQEEALGTCWDNPDGLDIRFTGRVILPPLVSALSASPSAYDYSVVGPVTNRNSCLSNIGGGAGHLYVGIGNGLYYTDSSRAALTLADTLANATRINAIFEYCEQGTTDRYLYYCGTGGTGNSTLRRSSSGTGGYTDASSKCIEDAIVFEGEGGDRLILGSTPIAKIIASRNGVDWSDDGPSDDWPTPITYFESGVGSVSFIGVCTGVWQGSAVYFLNNGKLYCLDVASATTTEIPVGGILRLRAACVHQDTIVVTDGWSVRQYTAGAATMRDISPRAKDGLPSCMSSGCITALISDGYDLYAIWSLKDSNKTQLMVYTGSGWSPLGPDLSSFTAFTGFVERLPVTYTAVQSRRIWLVGATSYSGTSGAGARLYSVSASGKGPVVGLDSFADGPLSIITGWINGGFSDLKGIVIKMKVDGYHLSSTETVKVEYRLDNDESASWTTLGTFTSTTDTLWFDANHVGVEFYTIQFKITLDRGSTVTCSPDLRGLVLAYDKKPEFRSAWTIRIDVDRMIERKVQVNGANATAANIWSKIKSLYNEKRLLKLVVPTLEPEGVRVHIADIPSTFDDFRAEVAGRGYIDLQLIEPVAQE